MNIQEVAGAKLWAELRKQIDLIKPRAGGASKPSRKPRRSKKAKSSDLARATSKLSSAVAQLKAQSPIKPVLLARPTKPR